MHLGPDDDSAFFPHDVPDSTEFRKSEIVLHMLGLVHAAKVSSGRPLSMELLN